MKVIDFTLTTDYGPLEDRIDGATDGASADTLRDIRSALPHRSGRLASTMRLEQTGTEPGAHAFAIVPGVPYARAVEQGADVGPRRGPHMVGDHVIRDNGPRFIGHMDERMRAG